MFISCIHLCIYTHF